MNRIFNGETANKIGDNVKVCGWVDSIRTHGKLIFIDLRDKTGFLQAVFSENNGANEAYGTAKKLRPEWVVEITGQVNLRPKGMENSEMPTGKVELAVETLTVINTAITPPFELTGDTRQVNEETRLKYRYLDLRTERMRRNLILRHKVVKFFRDFMDSRGFIEIETPLLTKSTPEGARDFIVPSRLRPGQFYALPQSPQQYKQLLMVGGLERYFQVVKCLRDEDPRADRQPEFTQMDIEMSFVSQEDILVIIEDFYISLVREQFSDKTITQVPFPRISYKEAMGKYQSDKPDLRKDKNNPNELAFVFITDFPMFEWHEDNPSTSSGRGKWGATHHPFTSPKTSDVEQIKKTPETVLACQYDVALNGYEIGGGSIRTTNNDVLAAVFEVLGHSKREIESQFGHLLEAFQYGAPPHGGIALGLDRLAMLLAGENSIREVIAFPKTGDGWDPMMDTPSAVSKEQLKELKLKIVE